MYLGKNARYHFHSLEIEHCAESELQQVMAACERVEQEVWNPSESFITYFKKQTAVIYATYNDEIVAFALFDFAMLKDRLVVAGNECMVSKCHQGYRLPTLFAAIMTLHIQKDNRMRGSKRPYQALILISATVNFKLMRAFHRYDWLAKTSSFRPDKEIEEATQQYLQKENFSLLEADNLFFIKQAFPDVKSKSTVTPPPFVPKSFVPERGDAFLYVCRLEKFLLLNLRARIICWLNGFKFSNRLIPIQQLAYARKTI